MQAQLYRQYNQHGTLLYVGISLSVMSRIASHRRCSRWFKEVSHITVEHFASREDAMRAETDAIREEHPVYNVSKCPWLFKRERFDLTDEMLAYCTGRSITRVAKQCKVPRHVLEKQYKDWLGGRRKKGEGNSPRIVALVQPFSVAQRYLANQG